MKKFRFKVLFVLLTFTRTRFLAQRLHFAQKKLIGIRVVIPLAAYNVANNDWALKSFIYLWFIGLPSLFYC